MSEKGCNWTNTVSRGIQHLEECEFLPVLCPRKCVESDGERRGEVMRLERRQLAEHEREYCPQRELKCEFCGSAMRACDMNPHLGECEEFPVDCPNCCDITREIGTGQMKRGAVPLHLAECPLQRVKCPYRENGCGEEMERRQLAEHGREYCPQRELKCEFCGSAVRACDMNPHLGECEEFPVDCPNCCDITRETGTGQMKRGAVPLHLAECPLQRVKCPYRENGCDEEMERRQLEIHEREYMHTHFRLAMKEMKQNKIESNELKAQILQANNKIKYLEKLSENKDFEIILVKKEIKELKTHSIDMKQNKIESNDRIQFLEKQNAILIEALSSPLAPTGGLEWKINRVKQKIQDKEDTYSDPFYVGLYKCQGNIEWHCDDTGKVGFFIYIMKGEFDEKLKWPFIYKVKLVLLNQNRNEDNHILFYKIEKDDLQKYPHTFQRPTKIRNEGFGDGSFISNAGILTKKYCKDNSISLHITVEQLPSPIL